MSWLDDFLIAIRRIKRSDGVAMPQRHNLTFGAGFTLTDLETQDAILVEGGSLPGGEYVSDYLSWDGAAWATAGERVHIGSQAGETGQGAYSVAIGKLAGNDTQGVSAVAIGVNAGAVGQAVGAIAIGKVAGHDSQGADAVALGYEAGETGQGAYSVAIGSAAGNATQGERGVAIGLTAGTTSQGPDAVAIGSAAGRASQGPFAIAIGQQAGKTSQHESSIVINASGVEVNSPAASTLTIKPIRSKANLAAGSESLGYDTSTGEMYSVQSPEPYTSYSSAQTLAYGTDRWVDVTASSPAIITLPSAIGHAGASFGIKRSGSANVTIATTSAQTIDGGASLVLTVQFHAVTLISDGANWIIFSAYTGSI